MNDITLNLRPIKPDAADAPIRAIYDDTRHRLRLPWVGALFQGYAMYPPYLDLAWNAVKDSIETPQFDAEIPSGRPRTRKPGNDWRGWRARASTASPNRSRRRARRPGTPACRRIS
ncbi:MAG: halocarboxylic acid dehydrogenase DehI family protein [Chloroflexota bacterium]|nr:halocarboxylic acid dehydrogenase DehI family protein [Chloroflexota bacterium]